MRKLFLVALFFIAQALNAAQTLYPEIGLYGDNVLEKEDSEHHYGPDLAKAYEQFLKEYPGKEKAEFFSFVSQNMQGMRKVKYLEAAHEREDHLIEINAEGAFYKPLPIGTALMFVMDIEGNFYAHQKVRGDGKTLGFHHTTFTGARGVAFAGTIQIDQQGRLEWISDDSGHYRPLSGALASLLSHLESKGIPLEKIHLALRRTTQLVTAKEWLIAYAIKKDPIPGENLLH